MPDLSLLRPLAKELDITLNQLLRGEYIDAGHILEKSEQNIKDTVDYSHSKIQKKQNVIKIMVAVCMTIMVIFGHWVTQENYRKYGYYDTVEECRNEYLDTWGFVHGKDSVYWRDEIFEGRWYQVCMYITDDKCAIFLIEKINGKYQVTDRSGNSQYLKREDDDFIHMHNHMGYYHSEPMQTVYVHWDAVPGDKEIKFRDQHIEPLANVNGYTL